MNRETPPLARDEVHVWSCRATEPASGSRELVRMLLSSYRGQPPHLLRFVDGEHGKPSLEDNPSGVQFSVSHSGDQLVCGVAGRPVGIDIEEMRVGRDVAAIAAFILSPAERRVWEGLPSTAQVASLYRCWTQKEAVLKLAGIGLDYPLDEIDVEINLALPPSLLAIRSWVLDARSCTILEISTPPGYVGMLAVSGSRPVMREFSRVSARGSHMIDTRG